MRTGCFTTVIFVTTPGIFVPFRVALRFYSSMRHNSQLSKKFSGIFGGRAGGRVLVARGRAGGPATSQGEPAAGWVLVGRATSQGERGRVLVGEIGMIVSPLMRSATASSHPD